MMIPTDNDPNSPFQKMQREANTSKNWRPVLSTDEAAPQVHEDVIRALSPWARKVTLDAISSYEAAFAADPAGTVTADSCEPTLDGYSVRGKIRHGLEYEIERRQHVSPEEQYERWSTVRAVAPEVGPRFRGDIEALCDAKMAALRKRGFGS